MLLGEVGGGEWVEVGREGGGFVLFGRWGKGIKGDL